MTQTWIIDIHKQNGLRPHFDVYIGRATQYTEFNQSSIWHNPFTKKKYGVQCLIMYEQHIRQKIKEDPITYDLRQLVGKRLGCWCITTTKYQGTLVCHGQVLLKLIEELL